MSGETRATAEWVTPAPVHEPHRKRKKKAPPTTTLGAALAELRRLALTLAVICGATALVALLIAWLTSATAQHALPRAFYLVGVAVAAVGFIGGLGAPIPARRRAPVGTVAMNRSFSFGLLAAVLIGIGVALEILL